MNIDVSLSPKDISAISEQVASVLYRQIQGAHPNAFRKHAYTVEEVAQQISYSTKSVLSFIRKGRKDKNGHEWRLNAREPTPGDFRIQPADLDEWLSHF